MVRALQPDCRPWAQCGARTVPLMPTPAGPACFPSARMMLPAEPMELHGRSGHQAVAWIPWVHRTPTCPQFGVPTPRGQQPLSHPLFPQLLSQDVSGHLLTKRLTIWPGNSDTAGASGSHSESGPRSFPEPCSLFFLNHCAAHLGQSQTFCFLGQRVSAAKILQQSRY